MKKLLLLFSVLVFGVGVVCAGTPQIIQADVYVSDSNDGYNGLLEYPVVGLADGTIGRVLGNVTPGDGKGGDYILNSGVWGKYNYDEKVVINDYDGTPKVINLDVYVADANDGYNGLLEYSLAGLTDGTIGRVLGEVAPGDGKGGDYVLSGGEWSIYHKHVGQDSDRYLTPGTYDAGAGSVSIPFTTSSSSTAVTWSNNNVNISNLGGVKISADAGNTIVAGLDGGSFFRGRKAWTYKQPDAFNVDPAPFTIPLTEIGNHVFTGQMDDYGFLQIEVYNYAADNSGSRDRGASYLKYHYSYQKVNGVRFSELTLVEMNVRDQSNGSRITDITATTDAAGNPIPELGKTIVSNDTVNLTIDPQGYALGNYLTMFIY